MKQNKPNALIKLRSTFDSWLDLKKTRSKLKFLEKARNEKSNGKRALIVNMGDWTYAIKTEAMLATGLRLNGWETNFLIGRPDTKRVQNYYRAFGFHSFFYWKLCTQGSIDQKQVDQTVEKFLEGSPDFNTIKNWKYHDCFIGPQILASVSRYFYEGHFDVNEPHIQKRMRQVLNRAIQDIYRTRDFLSREHFDLIILNEANYSFYSIIVDVAISMNIPVIQFTQPHRDDGLYFWKLRPDTRRQHPSSLSDSTIEKLKRIPWTEKQQEKLNSILSSRYNAKWFLQKRNQINIETKQGSQIRSKLKIPDNKKVAVVFSTVLWDANLFYGKDLFEDNGEWFIETVQAAYQNSNLHWLIKLHPANVWKRKFDGVDGELTEIRMIRDAIGKLPDHVTLLLPDCPYSTEGIFEIADYGITIRGTVGIELPCYGVPVVTAGTGRYSGYGFTIDSSNKEEYLKKLSQIETFPPLDDDQREFAQKHALAALNARLWLLKSFQAKFEKDRYFQDPISYNLTCKASSIEEIKKNGDLQAWASWAEDRNSSPDFFDPKLF